jgi:putative transcriptional regulator
MWEEYGFMAEDRLAGRLLVASPVLLDPNFVRAVVLLLQHDEEGAVGVILNRPTEEPVERHLPEWTNHLEEPPVVFLGGPVEPSVAIGVARTDTPADAELPGVDLVDLGSDPAGQLDGGVRVFSGYAGWGAGQLEDELAEGAWLVLNAWAEDVFSEQPEDLWSQVLRRQGGRIAMLATFPFDPSLN